MTAMLKRLVGLVAGAVAERHQLVERDAASVAQPPKYVSISSRGNRSMPAGTGVWVVKTSPARTASSASANVRPSSTISSADALEPEEAGVALVGVEHLGARCRAPSQGAHAADAEQDLLAAAGARCRRRTGGR